MTDAEFNILQEVDRKRMLLIEALEEAREALDNYSDVEDSDDGPRPNVAMRAITAIDFALGRLP